MRGKLPLIFFVTALLFSAAAEALVLIPQELRGPSAYLEIVRETSDCPNGACFVEYIVLSDGQALKKQYDNPAYDKTKPLLETRTLPPETAERILAKATQFFSEPRRHSNKKKDRDTLYYHDGDKLHAFTASNDEERPAGYADIFAATQEAFDAGEADEDFYVHDYYQPVSGDIEDFHVFPSGTVIFSLFTRKEVRLRDTGIFSLDEATLETVKKLSRDAFVQKPAPYSKCPASSGLAFAHIEIKNEGAVYKSYTCAVEDAPLTRLFRYIRATKPENVP